MIFQLLLKGFGLTVHCQHQVIEPPVHGLISVSCNQSLDVTVLLAYDDNS